MEPKRQNIFISYSHQDSQWLEKFNIFLKPLVRSTQIFIWNDTHILPGQNWKDEIKNALDNAKIAILLVSPNFLASDFINDEELPVLLKASKNNGLIIFWISLSHCMYHETEIYNYQAANDPSKPLDSLPEFQQNKIMVEICNKIIRMVNGKQEEEQNSQSGNNIDIPEIAPDDWFSDNRGGIFSRIKKFF